MGVGEGRRLSARGATRGGGRRGTSQRFEANRGIPDAGTVDDAKQE